MGLSINYVQQKGEVGVQPGHKGKGIVVEEIRTQPDQKLEVAW